MKIFALAAVGTLLALGAILPPCPVSAQDDVAATYRSDHAGRRYDFTVTRPQIMASPDWPEDKDSPPLPPRKALALARADLATFLPDAARWDHPKITLAPVAAPHKWMYIVEFEGPLPAGTLDGPVDLMRVLVLMSGTAVKPVVASSNP